MKYDFETLTDRSETSSKWHAMLEYDVNIAKDIVPLSTADMEFMCSPCVVDALKKYVTSTILGYSYMNDSFVSSYIDWMARHHNYHVESSSMVATSGVVSSLFTAVKAFTKEGDGVVIMPPVYAPFYFAVDRTNRRLIECNLRRDNGTYEIDFERLEEVFKSEKTKALIFCSPHNPVGRVWKKEELEKLSSLCVEHGIFVIADEIHHDIIMPGFKHTVMETVDERLKKQIITCTSLSKTANLASLSLSISVIPNEENRLKFIEELEKIPQHVNNGLSYKAYESFYRDGDEWFTEMLSVISNNLRFATDYIAQNIPRVKAYFPEGTYLLWLDFSSLNLSDERLEKFLKDDAKLFLTPGYVFGKDEGKGFARMNVATPKKIIEDALNRLKKAIFLIST